MKLTGIESYTKYEYRVDGMMIEEYFYKPELTYGQKMQLEKQFAEERQIPRVGVTLNKVYNNRKINNVWILNHKGKIS